jgi:DNA-binding CsgD family transcriptional regulator
MSIVNRTAKEFMTLLKTEREDPQYHFFVSEDDNSKVLVGLNIVERMFPDHVIMLCNRSHPKLQWASENCYNLFGLTASEFIRLPVPEFFGWVHPEDLLHVQQCFEFINSSEPYDPMRHRFVLYYRIRTASNEYIHLRDEKLAIETQPGKFIYFTMFRNITSEEWFFHVKLEVLRYSNGKPVKVYTYNPRQNNSTITPRQNDIAKLIIQGLSNQEISNRLHVSVSTVKNHKRALFRKVNVKTSNQLINLMAVQYS